jgi:hypothetical protein
VQMELLTLSKSFPDKANTHGQFENTDHAK